MTNISERKEQLELRLKELGWRLVEVETALDQTPNPDAPERAVEREGDEVLESLGLSGQKEIARIKAALDRIENGTYGECMKCGGTISQERLDVVPDAALCRECART